MGEREQGQPADAESTDLVVDLGFEALVDQDRPLWHLEQDRVALTDVENRQPQACWRRGRVPRPELPADQEHGRYPDERTIPADAKPAGAWWRRRQRDERRSSDNELRVDLRQVVHRQPGAAGDGGREPAVDPRGGESGLRHDLCEQGGEESEAEAGRDGDRDERVAQDRVGGTEPNWNRGSAAGEPARCRNRDDAASSRGTVARAPARGAGRLRRSPRRRRRRAGTRAPAGCTGSTPERPRHRGRGSTSDPPAGRRATPARQAPRLPRSHDRRLPPDREHVGADRAERRDLSDQARDPERHATKSTPPTTNATFWPLTANRW